LYEVKTIIQKGNFFLLNLSKLELISYIFKGKTRTSWLLDSYLELMFYFSAFIVVKKD
jgi:hypothetical protein